MLSHPVHKDLTKYQAKIAGGLTARSLAFTAMAVGSSVAVGLYSWFVLGIDFDSVSWVAYGLSVPFWALGFWRPLGMVPERWLPLWWRHETEPRITYGTGRRYEGLGLVEREFWKEGGRREADRKWMALRRQRAVELWSPSDGYPEDRGGRRPGGRPGVPGADGAPHGAVGAPQGPDEP